MFWWGPESSYNKDKGLGIKYGYYDDQYDGDDWEFRYVFDIPNSQRFINAIGTGEDPETVVKYIEDHFDNRSALEEFCENNGIHGECTHIGEYPPALFGPYEF